jgi:hypothetical protein
MSVTCIITYEKMEQNQHVENYTDTEDAADAEDAVDAKRIDAPRKGAVKKAPKLPYDGVHVRRRALRVETPQVDRKAKRATKKAVKESRTEKSAMT